MMNHDNPYKGCSENSVFKFPQVMEKVFRLLFIPFGAILSHRE